jgi:uncharacterized protein YdbL (DUF1318 family)
MAKRIAVLSIVSGLFFLLGAGISAAAGDEQRAELKASFKARYPKLLALKDEGRVGETWDGFVAAVKDEYLKDGTVKRIIEEENSDRRAFYKLLAEEHNTTPEVVASRNAARIAKEASPGQYFKNKEGAWQQKEKEP